MIRRIGIATKGRAGCVARLVRGMRARGFTGEILVSDDTGGEQVSASLAAEPASNGPLRVLGRDARRRLAGVLARAGIDRTLVEWSLFGAEGLTSAGANRNALALWCAGEPLLALDDDLTGLAGRAPGAGDGLRAQSGDPTELEIFPSRAAALGWARTDDVDLAAAHGASLGKSVGELGGEAWPPSLVQCGSLLRAKIADPRTPVLATWTGWVGATHTPNPLGQRLAPEVARTVKQLTVGDGSFFTPAAAGYDLRRVLPPFLPILRGQGMLFGAVLWSCYRAVVAYLPLIVQHDPPPGEEVRPIATPGASGAFCLLGAMMTAAKPIGRTDVERMSSLGRELEVLAQAPLPDLLSRIHSGIIALLPRDTPVPEDVARRGVPCDLERALGLEKARESVPRLLGSYGRLLHTWPQMWEVACEARRRGQLGA